jgi:hypothetical protein
MAFKMIRDLTWQTLTMVATVWAIAGYLGDIETNFAPPTATNDNTHSDGSGGEDASALPE